ncbi:MAG: hypothetical protein HFJ50_02630 [Clostridia bacterium]|nr:hypothetical protein [Clostridia bacterium]
MLSFFVNESEVDKFKKDIVSMKANIINSYAYVDMENWEKVQEEIGGAEKKIAQMMSEVSKEGDKRNFNVNKVYILVEELKNSLVHKDKVIFYIKYKNLIEEINTLI